MAIPSAHSATRDQTRPVPGNRLDIQASVDLDGIAKLKEMLSKYEEILKMLG